MVDDNNVYDSLCGILMQKVRTKMGDIIQDLRSKSVDCSRAALVGNTL